MNHRICFIGSEITPSEGSTFVGGHVNTVVGLCKGLTNLGWEMHIVTTPSRFLKGRVADFTWARFHIVHPKGSYNSLSYNADFLFKAVSTVETLAEKTRFDLVHAHSGYFGPAIIPAILKKRIGIPALFSLYCPASLLPRKLPIDTFGVKAISLGLDRIIAVTANVKTSLTNFGIDVGKITVLHSCYDEDTYRLPLLSSEVNTEKPLLGSHNQCMQPKVLFVGNVERTKGLDIFISAAKSILRSNPDVKFIITLHEPSERLQQATTYASQTLGCSVEVLGVVQNMAQLMASVDIVVAPFRSTAGVSDVPIIVLEAMALGKPVVASNLNGVKEAIENGKNGVIINLESSEELAEQITFLLNNPHFCEKIGQAAMLSAKRFSYSEISRRLNDIYLEVLEDA